MFFSTIYFLARHDRRGGGTNGVPFHLAARHLLSRLCIHTESWNLLYSYFPKATFKKNQISHISVCFVIYQIPYKISIIKGVKKKHQNFNIESFFRLTELP